MLLEIFISSLLLALMFLTALAWKWRINIKTAIWGGIVIGGLNGLIVAWIQAVAGELNLAFIILIELSLILIMTFIVIMARFYRDPERYPVETEKVILSPADGKVIYVNQVEKGSSLVSTKGRKKFELDEIASTDVLANAAYLVGIDMNILNVHVNRSPIEGEIVFWKRTRGRFMSLRKQESEIENERVTTVINNGTFSIGVIQISSRLVRKIISYFGKGDSLQIGQRLGAIVFGSQVDIIIPELDNFRMEAKSGDDVKAGISIIARYG
jgi:phosphatidylserine decarboxylase